jgi:hypothetical protein
MISYTAILNKKYAGSQWTLNGDDYAGLVWLSNTDKPTKKELDDLWPQVQSEMAAEIQTKAAEKAALLDRLGITEAEAKLLLS